MNFDLKNQRVVSLSCPKIHHLVVTTLVLFTCYSLFLFFFSFFGSSPYSLMGYPGGFSKLRIDDGGTQRMARG